MTTKTWKTSTLNRKSITSELSIADRIDVMAQKDAFVTLKDHKDNLIASNPKCRLINPSKSELDKVSKVVLDRINSDIRSAMHWCKPMH